MHSEQLDFGGDLCTECGGTGEIPVRKGREGAYRKCPRCSPTESVAVTTVVPTVALPEPDFFPRRVDLSDALWDHAVAVGRRRQDSNTGRADSYGYRGDDGVSLHIVGAIGEQAVALDTGHEWVEFVADSRTLEGNDVGRFGVRATKWQSGGLLLHPYRPGKRTRSDHPDKVFLGCTVAFATHSVIVYGWLRAREAHDGPPEWWHANGLNSDGRPCYLVPQHSTHRDEPEGYRA